MACLLSCELAVNLICLSQIPLHGDGAASRLDLPDEILLHVFSYLETSQLARCARVCHQFARIALDETLCKFAVCEKHY